MCRNHCNLETCGASGCTVVKRSIADAPFTFEALSLDNDTSEAKSVLEKRVFTFPSRGPWTPTLMTNYLIQAIEGGLGPDPQFSGIGVQNVLVQGTSTMGTTALAETFGNARLQLGNGGLHGCTQLTIISKRAVYMVGGSDL